MLAWVALLAACPSRPVKSSQVVSEVKSGLIAREAKLKSYHLVVDSHEEGAVDARHEVFYRAPYRLRGVVRSPSAFEISFDGEQLFVLQEGQLQAKKIQPSEETAVALYKQFAALVPEGFAVPLLPSKGVTGSRLSVDGDDAAQLSVQSGEGATAATTSWVYRWPDLELIEKRTEQNGQIVTIKVDERHCDQALKLCVPKKLSRWEQGKPIGTVVVSTLELNPELPVEDFTLHAPAVR